MGQKFKNRVRQLTILFKSNPTKKDLKTSFDKFGLLYFCSWQDISGDAGIFGFAEVFPNDELSKKYNEE